jgi:hypothetical protein
MGDEVLVGRSAWRSLFKGPEPGINPLIKDVALFLIKRHEDNDPGLPSTCLLHHVKNPDRTFGQFWKMPCLGGILDSSVGAGGWLGTLNVCS